MVVGTHSGYLFCRCILVLVTTAERARIKRSYSEAVSRVCCFTRHEFVTILGAHVVVQELRDALFWTGQMIWVIFVMPLLYAFFWLEAWCSPAWDTLARLFDMDGVQHPQPRKKLKRLYLPLSLLLKVISPVSFSIFLERMIESFEKTTCFQ